MSFSSTPAPGTSGITAGASYQAITDSLDSALLQLETLKKTLNTVVVAGNNQAQATFDSLNNQADGIRAQAIAGIVGGVLACVTAVIGFVASIVSVVKGFKMQTAEKNATTLKTHLKTVVEGPDVPHAVTAEAPAGAPKKFNFEEEYQKAPADKKFDVDHYNEKGMKELTKAEAEKILSEVEDKLKAIRKELKLSRELAQGIGGGATAASQASSQLSNSVGQHFQANALADQAKAEQRKQIMQTEAQQFQTMLEMYQKELQQLLDLIQRLNDQTGHASQQASS